MADTIALKIKEYESPKVKCATCDNNITELRAMQLPICDECINDLREIINERRL
jgi:Zn finger protein HypA/HybF involved in hydrogenase expression